MLTEQPIDIVLTNGINTKIDPKLQLQGSLQQLNNAVFDKIGQINKRNGFTALSRATSSGTLSEVKALANIGEELGCFDGYNFFSYSNALDTFIDKGRISSVIATKHEVKQDSGQQINPDVTYAAGMEFYVWEDSRNSSNVVGGVDTYIKVIDSLTRAEIVSETLLKAQAFMGKAYILGTRIVFPYITTDSTNLCYKYLTLASPLTGLSAEAIIKTGITVSFDGSINRSQFDASLNNAGDKLYFTYVVGAGLNVRTLDSSLTLGTDTVITSPVTTANTISTVMDSTDRLWVFFFDGQSSPTGLNYIIRSSTLTSVLTKTSIQTAIGANDVYRIAPVMTSSSSADVYYEMSATDGYNTSIKKATCSSGGSVTGIATFKKSVGLAGHIFSHGGRNYLPIAHESPDQSTYFITDLNDGKIICKLLPGTGGGLEFRKTIPHVAKIDNDTFLFPNLIKGVTFSETAKFFSLLGLSVTKLDFSNENAFFNVFLGEQMLAVGGMLSSYDGATINEHNFHLFPEKLTLSQFDGYGDIINGNYNYKATYSWMDNKGNLHESEDSDIFPITTTGSNDTVSITGPMLRITDKTSVQINVYRTTDTGTVFFKLNGIDDQILNDPTQDTWTYIDEFADDEIDSNQPLYTEGELYNSAPPSCGIVTTWKNRVFLAGLEDPNQIWFSKEASPGSPINFNDSFVLNIPPLGGAIKDLIPMRNFLAIAKERAIMSVYGQGPSASGGPSDYTDLQIISSDLGARFTGCAVEIPDGVLFPSNKGIYHLTHDGNIDPAGVQADDFKDLNFVSGISLPNKNIAVFATSDDVFVIYDWYNQQWSTWTGLSNVTDLIAVSDTLFASDSDGYISKYDETSFLDHGNPIELLIGTGELQPMGQMGWFLLSSLTFLGTLKSAHTLEVKLYFNFRPGTPKTITVTPTGMLTTQDVYQWSRDIMVYIQSFRVVIRDTNQTGESFAMSGLRISIAPVTGNVRLPSKARGA